MSKSKKQFFTTISMCSVLILVYIVMYVNQGQNTAYLTKISINKYDTLQIYNATHADMKNVEDFYTDKDILNDVEINKYVYHFTLSTNSKIFRKNYIYNIYPDFNSLPMPIEYAYMHTQGDKYGNLLSLKKLKSDNIGPISVNLVMNDKIFYWLIFGIFAIFFICYVVPFVLHKLHPHINKIGVACNSVDSPPPPQVFSYLFVMYVFVLSLFLISQYKMVSLEGDNWLMSAVYDSFYMPYNTTIGWQRGRHFADLFMSLSMRPFGEMLIALGMKPLLVFNIFSSLFTLLFYGMFFIACSVFIWLLNNKQQFRTIFVLISLCFLLIVNGRIDYVTTAAYIGSAGIALLVWLPILYFFVYQKVFRVGSSFCLQSSILFFLAYAASFQTETSTLPVFGLTLFVLLYMYIFRRNFIASYYTYYHMALFIIFVPLAFILTMVSGRGQTQVNVMGQTTFFDNIRYVWSTVNHFSSCIVIVGFLYLIYLIIQCVKQRKLELDIYFQMATLFVGLLGVLGLACIRVPGIWFEIMLIGLILCLFLLRLIQNQNIILSWCGNFGLVGFIFCALLQNINILERNFVKYYDNNTQETLISLFQEAAKNNMSEIVLTPKDIVSMKLEMQYLSNDEQAWPNRDISAWMKRYYIHTYIPIRVLDKSVQNGQDID